MKKRDELEDIVKYALTASIVAAGLVLGGCIYMPTDYGFQRQQNYSIPSQETRKNIERSDVESYNDMLKNQ